MSAEDAKQEAVGGLDDGGVSGNIKLTSKDAKAFELPKKNSLISTLVKTSLDTDPTATEIPIPGVQAEILEKVIEYMNHHGGVEPPIVEKPLRSKVMKEVVKDEWDAIYIDKIGDNRQQLYDLILAANYTDVKSLLHLGCAKVARSACLVRVYIASLVRIDCSLIKGQPLEKIKEILSAGIKKEEEKEAAGKPNNSSSSSGSSAIVASYAASSSSSSPSNPAAPTTAELPTAIRDNTGTGMMDD